MLALLTLAMIGQISADEWRPYTANPAYEVRGHMDRGVFRYTQSRLKTPAKSKSFETDGVKIEHERLIEGSVRGTDNDLARTLAEKDRSFHERARAEAPTKGLDVGQCPTRPRPEPHPHPPIAPPAVERDLFLFTLVAIIGLFLGLFILALKIVLIVLLVRWIYRKLTAPPPATPV